MMSTISIRNGDSFLRIAECGSESIDAIICDPPYGLKYMGSEGVSFDDLGNGIAQRKWHMQWLTPSYEVLKPRGFLVAFSGTRTQHHLGMAMELCGFTQIKLVGWVYSSGFPRSNDISKGVDKYYGLEREITGYKRGVKGAEGTGFENCLPGKATGIKQVQVMLPITAPNHPLAKTWDGWGTGLKPAWEPALMGFKS